MLAIFFNSLMRHICLLGWGEWIVISGKLADAAACSVDDPQAPTPAMVATVANRIADSLIVHILSSPHDESKGRQPNPTAFGLMCFLDQTNRLPSREDFD